MFRLVPCVFTNFIFPLLTHIYLFTFLLFILTVHFIGEVVGAIGFGGANVFAKWKFNYDSGAWRVIEGAADGRTWVAERGDNMEIGVWNDPIDVTLACMDLRGWPKLMIEIYTVDENNFVDFGGYAWTFLPTTPGEHSCNLPAFCPRGSYYDQLVSTFLGGRPRYEDPMVIVTPESRIGHDVVTMGYVAVNVSVVQRNFPKSVIFGPNSSSSLE